MATDRTANAGREGTGEERGGATVANDLRERATPEPRVDEELPDTCLSFTIRGPWGHFRRIEGNLVKQTYRIIPRTTVAGMIAAMLGYDRNSYYGLFDHEHADIAVEPLHELRTLGLAQNVLATAEADGDFETIGKSDLLKIEVPESNRARKQHNFEVLADPAYRIDIRLASEPAYTTLRDLLDERAAVYPPSLGLSEFLARVEYHGEFEVETVADAETVTAVDSAVPDAEDNILPPVDGEHRVERSPSAMEMHAESDDVAYRRTTDYTAYSYRPDAGELEVRDASASRVDGRTVMFC